LRDYRYVVDGKLIVLLSPSTAYMIRAPYFTKLGRWTNFYVMEVAFLATSIPMLSIYGSLGDLPRDLGFVIMATVPLLVYLGCSIAYYKVVLRHLGASAVLFRMHPGARTMT
jgi:hypothetical protein